MPEMFSHSENLPTGICFFIDGKEYQADELVEISNLCRGQVRAENGFVRNLTVATDKNIFLTTDNEL